MAHELQRLIDRMKARRPDADDLSAEPVENAKRAQQCWVCRMGIAPGDLVVRHRRAIVHQSCGPRSSK